MTGVTILFSSARLADRLVAGIPAVARVVREVQDALPPAAGRPVCTIALPGGTPLDPLSLAEIARIAGQVDIRFADNAALLAQPGTLFIAGESLPASAQLRTRLAEPVGPGGRVAAGAATGRDPAAVRAWGESLAPARHLAHYRGAERAIIRGTRKPGDGIVSQLINRPLSGRMSQVVLRWPAARPIHATIAAAITGLAMAACLLLGGEGGLLAGAVLLQVASVVDGVDGEMARATLRTSTRGASLDSITDGATNLAFVAGLAYNLWAGGKGAAALAGLACCGCFALGLILLGWHAKATGQPVHFDTIKRFMNGRAGLWRQVLVWLVQRDFLAAASMVAVLAGMAWPLLQVFALTAAIWLGVVLYVLGVALRRGQIAVQPAVSTGHLALESAQFGGKIG